MKRPCRLERSDRLGQDPLGRRSAFRSVGTPLVAFVMNVSGTAAISASASCPSEVISRSRTSPHTHPPRDHRGAALARRLALVVEFAKAPGRRSRPIPAAGVWGPRLEIGSPDFLRRSLGVVGQHRPRVRHEVSGWNWWNQQIGREYPCTAERRPCLAPDAGDA
jgi:hypothetical protein